MEIFALLEYDNNEHNRVIILDEDPYAYLDRGGKSYGWIYKKSKHDHKWISMGFISSGFHVSQRRDAYMSKNPLYVRSREKRWT